jgi:hypothetical protein
MDAFLEWGKRSPSYTQSIRKTLAKPLAGEKIAGNHPNSPWT